MKTNKELMKRYEVIKIINDKIFGLVDTGQAKRWLELFEALGMIDFKEEQKLSTKITEAGIFGIHEDTVLKVMDNIDKAGYKIVSK